MSEKKKNCLHQSYKKTFCSPLYNKQLKIHEKALKELNRVLCLCPGSSWIVFEILINMGGEKEEKKNNLQNCNTQNCASKIQEVLLTSFMQHSP